jgi:hypothetical protein
MDSAAIILAVPAALWALAWWDVQRRKQVDGHQLAAVQGMVSGLSKAMGEEATRRLEVEQAVHTLAKTVGAIERDNKELSAIVSNNRPKLSKFQRGG